ncbi:YTH domain-containing protein, putative, partial [Plasmodium malariae]
MMVVHKKSINKKKKGRNMYELYLSMHEEKYKKVEEEKSTNDEAYVVDLEREVKIKLEEQSNLLSIKGIDRVDIQQKKGKHSIICIHYIKNMCMKNLFCNYLHQLIYSRIPTCKNYLKYNYCADRVRGSCMFRHTLENTNSNYYNDNKDEYLDDIIKFLHEKNICVNYLLGFCNLGYNCRKIHINRTRKYINIISILPKFYLDEILINKSLYTNLYSNSKKFINDMNKLRDALIVLSGEKYYDKTNISSKNEKDYNLTDHFKNTNTMMNNNNINESHHIIPNSNGTSSSRLDTPSSSNVEAYTMLNRQSAVLMDVSGMVGVHMNGVEINNKSNNNSSNAVPGVPNDSIIKVNIDRSDNNLGNSNNDNNNSNSNSNSNSNNNNNNINN